MWVSVVAARGLGVVPGLQSTGSIVVALLLHSRWDPPGPGIERVSPALAGRFFTTEPSEKPSHLLSTEQIRSADMSMIGTSKSPGMNFNGR